MWYEKWQVIKDEIVSNSEKCHGHDNEDDLGECEIIV